MNKKVIIGNFKMNILPSEVIEYLKKLKEDVKNSNNEIVICMPYVDIPYSPNIVENTNIHICAQNMHYEEEGSYTGEISVKMLKSIKTEYIMLGHYERRKYFLETEEMINKKIRLALKYDLKPIVCIGSNNSLEDELNIILKELTKEEIIKIIFIYEPIKSIGTGNIIDKNIIDNKIIQIRNILRKRCDNYENIIIGYGGSINSDNVIDLLEDNYIKAILVGSSSLNEQEFSKIVNSI